MNLPARFWDKVNKRGPRPEGARNLGPCWLWTASLDRYGYGQWRTEQGKVHRAHRVAYERLVGEVGQQFDLDHLCRVRHCVNPRHLEPVTRRVNLLRGTGVPATNAAKTHCPKGHEYNEENTERYNYRGCVWRRCRICRAAASRRQEQERRQ